MRDALSLSREIVKVTEDMLCAADCGRWEEVRVQQRRRERLLAEMQCGGIPAEHERGAFTANLQTAATLNKRLTDLGLQARMELHRAIVHLQRGRRANLAYGGLK